MVQLVQLAQFDKTCDAWPCMKLEIVLGSVAYLTEHQTVLMLPWFHGHQNFGKCGLLTRYCRKAELKHLRSTATFQY